LRVTAFSDTDLLAQLLEDAFGDLTLLPLLELPVHRLPRREIDRQLPPRTTATDYVQDRVHNRPAGMLRDPTRRLDQGKQRLDDLLLAVGQI
jgi:hypothetical protein